MEPPACILLIDDHVILLDGLRLLLEARLEGARIAVASSLAEALTVSVTPTIIVLDVKLPGISGLAGIPLLLKKWPAARIVVLSSQSDEDTREQAIAAGASGFLAKAESGDRIVEFLCRLVNGEGETPVRESVRVGEQRYLTPRQCEVLDLICHGMTNKMIAKKLQLSENTVRRHLQDIFAFLRVVSRTEAVFEARRRGIVA